MDVILILLDTLRKDHLGCYGNDWIKTPHLDAFAQDSVRFTNAFIGSYPCMPTRRDMWTGQYEFPFRGWGPLEQEDINIPKLICESGHTSSLITDHYHYWHEGSGNYHNAFTSYHSIRGQEADRWVSDCPDPLKFPAPSERLRGIEQHLRNTSRFFYEEDYFAPQVFGSAIHWVQDNHQANNWFLMIESFDPHEPWDPPYPYNDLYNPGHQGDSITFPFYGPADYLTKDEIKQMKALYAGEITMVDRWFGRFIDELKHRGRYDDTTIIVTTDHGHLLGEHNTVGKPGGKLGTLWRELSEIPIFIKTPGNKHGGSTREHIAQNVDLMVTAADFCEVTLSGSVHGLSLKKVIDDPQQTTRHYAHFGIWGHAHHVTDGQWSFHLWPTNEKNRDLYWHSSLRPEFWHRTWPGKLIDKKIWLMHPETDFCQPSALFDLNNDPSENHNVWDQNPDVVKRFKQEVIRFLKDVNAPDYQFDRLGLNKTLTAK